jgi:putative thioredoxin
MAIDVTEATFEAEVLDRSRSVPVVVDFWAEWCGPCRTLGPVLERAAESRGEDVVLAKVDVDSNQSLAARFGVQGIPAVKAFRDGQVASEFVGAQPPAQVEAFFDALVPSRADRLAAAADEGSLREALVLEPGRADASLALARLLRKRGEDDEALQLLDGVAGDFEAEGLAARIRLARGADPPLAEGLEALDAGRLEPGLEALLAALPGSEDGRRDEIRRAVVGALAELDPSDPRGREYRRRLAAALY